MNQERKRKPVRLNLARTKKSLFSLLKRNPIYTAAGVMFTLVFTTIGIFTANAPDIEKINAETDPLIQSACSDVFNTQVKTMDLPELPYERKSGKINIFGEIGTAFTTNNWGGIELLHTSYARNFVIDISRISDSNPAVFFQVHVNSMGGDLNTASHYLNAIHNRGNVITVIHDHASSAASLIAFSGTHGYRWANEDSSIILHNSREYDSSAINPLVFEEDHQEDTAARGSAHETNNWLKERYQQLSKRDRITKECIEAIIRGNDDTIISPEFALKAGWVDYVTGKNWWTDMYDGTVMVRKNDRIANRTIKSTTRLALN